MLFFQNDICSAWYKLKACWSQARYKPRSAAQTTKSKNCIYFNYIQKK